MEAASGSAGHPTKTDWSKKGGGVDEIIEDKTGRGDFHATWTAVSGRPNDSLNAE